ncbi:MAG: hypothetical protein N2606_05640, partial [Candidatus Omnitrophica bacterium]|nr:hypothetical protein [Candidatus Omnitrophota bacterium]
MSKKTIVFAILALVVGITFSAYAEVQNVKVGGDLGVIGATRSNLDFTKDADADAWVGQARVKIDAELTDNVGVTFRLLNERVWGGTADDNSEEVDVDLAYVTMKEFLNDTVGFPWTVVVGRQNIQLGSGLLIGAAGTNKSNTTQLPAGLGDLSLSSAFDAIVNVMDFSPLTVTAAYVKASEGAINEGKDSNVWALAGSFNLGEEYKNAVIEGAYVLDSTKKANIHNYDVRLVVSPLENLGVEAEYAYQTRLDLKPTLKKTKNADVIRLAASLGLPDVAWAPTIGLDYARLSKYWNPMHENWVPADLANALFDNTNCQLIGATVSAKPMDALLLKLRYANLRAAKK